MMLRAHPQTFPPGPFFDRGRWSNGPTWAGALLQPAGRERCCMQSHAQETVRACVLPALAHIGVTA